MNVTLHIPDALAARLGANGAELERRALEGLVLQGYRSGRMTLFEVREALGFDVLDQVDGFLKAHGVFEASQLEDVERDVQTLVRLGV